MIQREVSQEVDKLIVLKNMDDAICSEWICKDLSDVYYACYSQRKMLVLLMILVLKVLFRLPLLM